MAQHIKYDGTGADTPRQRVHFAPDFGSDHTLCGETLDRDPDTAGAFDRTKDQVDCEVCIGIVEYCKAIKRSEYI